LIRQLASQRRQPFSGLDILRARNPILIYFIVQIIEMPITLR
jgi:hypothetical protein